MSVVMSDFSEPFLASVAKSFGDACDSYTNAARLQQQVALDALALLPTDPCGELLDVGCGPGWIHPRFSEYCAGFTAVDLSAGMLKKAAQQQLARDYFQADAAMLPLKSGSIDKVFSSLMLQWCVKPAAVFAEIVRVMRPGGRAVITTLVDGTLTELKQAFASVDNQQHVNHFLTENDVVSAAHSVQGIRWQVESRSYLLYYPGVFELARELKALGANKVAARSQFPQQGLKGRGYWQQLAEAYDTKRTLLGLPATYQVVIFSGYKDG